MTGQKVYVGQEGIGNNFWDKSKYEEIQTHLNPIDRHMCASPMPVFPAVPSTTVPPGRSCPFLMASWIRNSAALSFTEPPPLQNSALARISQPVSSLILFSLTKGVLPIIPTRPFRTASCEMHLLPTKFRCGKRLKQTMAAIFEAE